jgi:hypothetical protein
MRPSTYLSAIPGALEKLVPGEDVDVQQRAVILRPPTNTRGRATEEHPREHPESGKMRPIAHNFLYSRKSPRLPLFST